MKVKHIKKSLVMGLVIVLLLTVMGCTKNESEESTNDSISNTQNDTATTEGSESNVEDEETVDPQGTIMWLSNLSSGLQYETALAYLSQMAGKLGYDIQVVYGDMFNDPAGNLNAVKNNINEQVVGLIMSQDGGVKAIMDEFPDIYVAGYNTDMLSVYGDGGSNSEVLNNEKFLGTMSDGFYDGALLGIQYAKVVIEKGYKRVSTLAFPAFAYPNLTEADRAFRNEIDAYNATVSEDEKILVVGGVRILEFQPLPESYFLEDYHGDLDVIVGFLAGVEFVYPTMKSAMANGTCSADAKLITGGFNDEPSIVADIGGDGVIQFISISPSENIAWPLIMIDNALVGGMYSDYLGSQRHHSIAYEIVTKEDIDLVMREAMTGTGDVELTQLSFSDIQKVLTRFTPEATYQDLEDLFQHEQLTVAALKNR